MGRLLALVLCASACGRIAFESTGDATPSGDGSASDGGDGAPRLLGYSNQFGVTTAAQQFTHVVPSEANFLLVSLHIGSDCILPDPSVASVSSVTFAGLQMSYELSIVGTPCGPTLTRSELWWLANPPVGTGTVDIQLTQAATTIHGAAFSFADVATTSPILDKRMRSGNGMSVGVIVGSSANSLLLSFVGHGAGVTSSSATLIYQQNVNRNNTLNNTAAAYSMGGVAPSYSFNWQFVDFDEYQVIAVQLH